jgi:hypothetical protein
MPASGTRRASSAIQQLRQVSMGLLPCQRGNERASKLVKVARAALARDAFFAGSARPSQ